MPLVHFWISSVDHECCGKFRRVGDEITVPVCLGADDFVTESSEPDQITVTPSGEMIIFGDTHFSTGDRFDPGWLVRVGDVEIGFYGNRPSPRVRCQGTLWEVRHVGTGAPEGKLTGRIIGINWRRERRSRTGPIYSELMGYHDPVAIEDTNSYPGYEPLPDVADLVPLGPGVWRSLVSPFYDKTIPYETKHSDNATDEMESFGGPFEFILEVI